MTIRRYWVHDDEPMFPDPPAPPSPQPDAAPAQPAAESAAAQGERLLHSLLALIAPNPELLRAALCQRPATANAASPPPGANPFR